MKRFAVLALFALTVGLALAGCGSDEEPADGADGSPTMTAADDGHEAAGHDETSEVAADARRIEVGAESFEFDPDEIRVDTGENIAIALTSSDILHDFIIDELDAHVAADRGETTEGGFTANEPGRYTYYCSVSGHRAAGMEGTLVVE